MPYAALLALRGKAENDGRSLAISPVEQSHALQSLTISLPGKGAPLNIGSEGELSANDLDDALGPPDAAARAGRSWVPLFVEKDAGVTVSVVVESVGAQGLQVAVGLTAGLTVDAAAMRANLARYGGYPVSERALALLTPRLGARRAQDGLQQALGQGTAAGLTAEQAPNGSTSSAGW